MKKYLYITFLFLIFFSCEEIKTNQEQQLIQEKNEILESQTQITKETKEEVSKPLISNDLLGLWEHNDKLHNEISLEVDAPKGNLAGANAFGEIKMFFDENTYTSYFDNLVYTGIWKIEGNLLHMKRDRDLRDNIDPKNSTFEWVGYEYRLNNNELVIFSGQWLMTFIKSLEENN